MKRYVFLIFFSACFFSSTLKAQSTFNYTGAVQAYTVPSCVYTITVEVKGAEGAASPGSSIGGKGGRVQAILSVTPGEVLNIYVGGEATAAGGGWNGGGLGGPQGGSGGGASDIRRGGTDFSNRIVVAGGGGGGGLQISNLYPGGKGGGLIGGDGGSPSSNVPAVGKGGTQTEGGAGGTGTTAGSPGALGIGGSGGPPYGGGGGGGYYGGGGGATPAAYGGGGGGGSSYADSTIATNVIHKQGFQTGDGQLVITAPPGLLADAGPDTTICAGSSVTLHAIGGANYSWSPVEGLSCTDCPNPVASPTVTTNYILTVTGGSCTPDDDTVLVTVLDCGTGIANAPERMSLSVFPNPAENFLRIVINNGSSSATALQGGHRLILELMNRMGQVVYNDFMITGHAPHNPIKDIEVCSLPKGLYFLRVKPATPGQNQLGSWSEAGDEPLLLLKKLIIQ